MFVPVRSRPVVQIKKLYIYIKMKKVLFIAALVTLASCSNETTSSNADTLKCVDSTCSDSVTIDSLANRVQLRADSIVKAVKN